MRGAKRCVRDAERSLLRSRSRSYFEVPHEVLEVFSPAQWREISILLELVRIVIAPCDRVTEHADSLFRKPLRKLAARIRGELRMLQEARDRDGQDTGCVVGVRHGLVAE